MNWLTSSCETGIDFQANNQALTEVCEVLGATEPIAVTVDGFPIREVPGPKGYPYVGECTSFLPQICKQRENHGPNNVAAQEAITKSTPTT